MAILNSMSNLDPKEKLKAVKAFTDGDKRAIFIEMDEETQKLWILDP